MAAAFKRLDGDMDNVLSRDELDDFMVMSEGRHLDDETFEWMSANFDFCSVNNVSESGKTYGLTVDGFLSLYNYMVDSCDGDERLISKDIFFMGYNQNMELINAATYVLAVYSAPDATVSLSREFFDAEAYALAIRLPILKYGDKAELGGRSGLSCYSYKSPSGCGISFLIKNTSKQSYVVSMDCTGSINADTYCIKMKRSISVPKNSIRIIQHAVPSEEAAWSLTYKNSWEKTSFGL